MYVPVSDKLAALTGPMSLVHALQGVLWTRARSAAARRCSEQGASGPAGLACAAGRGDCGCPVCAMQHSMMRSQR